MASPERAGSAQAGPAQSAPEYSGARIAGFAAGLGFTVLGVAFLLQELGQLDVGWTIVLPIVIVMVGLGTALGGAIGAARRRGTQPPDDRR